MIHPDTPWYTNFSTTSNEHFWQLDIFRARAAAIFELKVFLAQVGMVGGFKHAISICTVCIEICIVFHQWGYHGVLLCIYIYIYTYISVCVCVFVEAWDHHLHRALDATLFAIAGVGSAMQAVRRQVTLAQQHGLFRAATASKVICHLLQALPLGKDMNTWTWNRFEDWPKIGWKTVWNLMNAFLPKWCHQTWQGQYWLENPR